MDRDGRKSHLGTATKRALFTPWVGALAFVFGACGLASAETDSESKSLHTMSIEELMAVTVRVASLRDQSMEEAPSIVSLVTRAEIEAYGARDLLDVLRIAGSFEPAIDVESLISVSFRGMWTQEGKALFMIDGQVMNDLAYANMNFIGSYPASMIERVEIIRGPGSAVYGTFAQVAVINIVMAKGAELDGGRATGAAAVVGTGETSYGAQASVGGVLQRASTPDISYTLHVGYGTHPLSSRRYEDFFGNYMDLGRDISGRDWQHIGTKVSAGNLEFNYLKTRLDFIGQDVFSEIEPPLPDGQLTELHYSEQTALSLKYQARPRASLSIEPSIEMTRGTAIDAPRRPHAAFVEYLGVDHHIARTRLQVLGTLEATALGTVTAGVGYLRDRARDVSDFGDPGFFGGESLDDTTFVVERVGHSAFALAQWMRSVGPVGVTVGGRYETSIAGNALAPRLGLTWARDVWSAKLLYGGAYRIPTTWQKYQRELSGINLRPETSKTVEMELGWKPARHLATRVAAFSAHVKDPITYSGELNAYSNLGAISSYGLEGELSSRRPDGGWFTNLSWTRPGSDTSPGFVTVNGRHFLAQSAFRLGAGKWWGWSRWRLGTHGYWLSPRYGQSAESAQSTTGLRGNTRYPSVILVNASLTAKQITPGLDVTLTAHNLFNEDYVLIQPYYGAHAPMPAQDREVTLSTSWSF